MCIRDRWQTARSAVIRWLKGKSTEHLHSGTFTFASQEPRIARIADWPIADWSSRVRDFATSDPLEARFRRWIRNLHETCSKTHPSRASGDDFEA
eukprot:12974822-Alexandrium_andersonii.AAC.1